MRLTGVTFSQSYIIFIQSHTLLLSQGARDSHGLRANQKSNIYILGIETAAAYDIMNDVLAKKVKWKTFLALGNAHVCYVYKFDLAVRREGPITIRRFRPRLGWGFLSGNSILAATPLCNKEAVLMHVIHVSLPVLNRGLCQPTETNSVGVAYVCDTVFVTMPARF